jgi:hypothetical protein
MARLYLIRFIPHSTIHTTSKTAISAATHRAYTCVFAEQLFFIVFPSLFIFLLYYSMSEIFLQDKKADEEALTCLLLSVFLAVE